MKIPSRDHVKTSFGRIAYQRAGSGSSIVLIHGSMTTADDMSLALFNELAKEFDVIAFDRPGHGGSDRIPGDQGSPYGQGMALQAAWEALGSRTPTIVGHSFGGAVALALATRMPNAVASVVALAPICFPEIRPEHLTLAPRVPSHFGEIFAKSLGILSDVATLPLMRNAMFLPQMMPDHYRDAFPFAWASRPDSTVADARDAWSEFRMLTVSGYTYASCSARVSILGGTHDLVVTNARHGLVAAAMMPLGCFKWVPGAGHMLHHFNQKLVKDTIHASRTH